MPAGWAARSATLAVELTFATWPFVKRHRMQSLTSHRSAKPLLVSMGMFCMAALEVSSHVLGTRYGQSILPPAPTHISLHLLHCSRLEFASGKLKKT